MRLAAIAAVAATAAFAAACGSDDDGGSTSTAGGGDAADVRMGALVFLGDPVFQAIQQGMEGAAQDAGVELKVNNTNNDPAAESRLMNDMIASRVDAILVSPLSPTGSLAAIRAASEAGIKVVCYNTCLEPPDAAKHVVANVTTDQTALGTQTGEAAAEYIEAELGGRATIGLLNCDAFEPCKLRKAGFKRALADAGVEVDYVADQEGFVADKATSVARDMLTANPAIDVMWAANEGGTIGAVNAVGAAGRAGEVVVFGTDISTAIAKALLADDDVLQATTGQGATEMGQLAFEAALDAVRDGTAAGGGDEVNPPNSFFSRADEAAVNEYLSTSK